LALDDEEEEAVDEDEIDLDHSAGVLDKSNDPVRLYLREMGIVPLLNREGEVTIAKRIERGQIKTHKAISRSPIAVERLLKIGDDLAAGKASIRETVVFSEQAEISIEEDKAEEYLRWTLEGIESIRGNFQTALKSWVSLINEQNKAIPGKKNKKLLRLKRQTARLRLDIASPRVHAAFEQAAGQLPLAAAYFIRRARCRPIHQRIEGSQEPGHQPARDRIAAAIFVIMIAADIARGNLGGRGVRHAAQLRIGLTLRPCR
jgi:hypothetical protein